MRINHDHPVLERVNRFLYSPAYFLYLGGLTILSNVFSLEPFAYAFLLLTGVYVCLCARDLLPILPIFACGYISPSLNNNPGRNDESIFSLAGGGLYLAILLTLLAVSLVYRLVTDPVFGGKKFLTKKRSLLSGMLLLGAAYGISGIGSGQWAEYGWRNLLFAFIQLVAIAGLYFLLSGAVRWEQAPRAYLFWTGVCVGYVLLVELLGIYIKEDVIVDGVIRRERIATGWGHYNSMGALLAMVIPLPFFLTGKGRYAWFAYLSAFFFCVGLLFTCSRGSTLIGVPIYVGTYLLSVVHSRHARSMKWMHVFHGMIILAPVLMLIIFDDKLLQMFRLLPDLGADVSFRMRLDTYLEGFKQFGQFPIFGGSFFPLKEDLYKWASDSTTFGYLFPPRWHNTLVQLLATGGVVCLAAYIVHRVQTVKLFTRHFTGEKLFVGMSVMAMLLTSMVDCHFFNVGPVLLYSAMLAVVEFRLDKGATGKEVKNMKKTNFERGTVVISIDDGDVDGFRVYENVFKKFGFGATYNIVTDLIGDADRLSRKQLEILYNDPLIELAAHGHTHQNDDADVSKSVECLYEWLDIQDDAIGFASPGSHMHTDFIEENAEHLRSMKLLYARTSRNNMPTERHLQLQERLKAQGAPEFVWTNAPQITYGFEGLAVNSVAVHHDDTVADMKKLTEVAVAEKACIVFMFHRFKKPGEVNYEGKLCYDHDQFVEFGAYLAQMRDAGKIDILTNAQAYRLGAVN